MNINRVNNEEMNILNPQYDEKLQRLTFLGIDLNKEQEDQIQASTFPMNNQELYESQKE